MPTDLTGSTPASTFPQLLHVDGGLTASLKYAYDGDGTQSVFQLSTAACSIDSLTVTTSFAVTGNMTITGTVDGRDIATDGTKLDTIETSATADQTGAEIKTAYESEADTNAFTDAEQTKLSGIETSADVTDATNVNAAGAVMNSDTSTAAMSFVIDEDAMGSDSATKVPTQQSVKAYVDASGGTPEGTAVLSTGEAGGTKFLREDGDGTCSWQAAAGSGDMVLADAQSVTGAKTFDPSTLKVDGSTSGTTTVNATAVAGTTTVTLPAATDTLVGKATTDTLTNKTINTASNTITVVEADISDLGTYLTTEANDLSAAVTWANVPNANITQGSVTQHQAALSITESQISDLAHTAALTTEQVQDIAGAMNTGNTETLITVTYQDADGTVDYVVDNDLNNYSNATSAFITATLTDEEVQDKAGAMWTGNTETGITVTYQDADGTIDAVVSDTTVAGDSGSTGITPGDTLTIAGGTGITTAMSGDTLTVTASGGGGGGTSEGLVIALGMILR